MSGQASAIEDPVRVAAEQDPALLLVELSLVPVKAARVSAEVLELGETMLTRTEAAAKRGLEGDDYEREGALVDARIRRWAEQTLQLGGYDVTRMREEWEIYWRRQGL